MKRMLVTAAVAAVLGTTPAFARPTSGAQVPGEFQSYVAYLTDRANTPAAVDGGSSSSGSGWSDTAIGASASGAAALVLLGWAAARRRPRSARLAQS